MSSSFLFSSSILLVFAFAAAVAASGGDGRHDADPQQAPPASNAGANPAPIHPDAKKITIVPAADVDAAFKKGYGFVESSEFKINAGRRDAAGGSEVHARD